MALAGDACLIIGGRAGTISRSVPGLVASPAAAAADRMRGLVRWTGAKSAGRAPELADTVVGLHRRARQEPGRTGAHLTQWSVARVEQLAPDAAAVKAAQGLAKPGKWRNVGRNERFLWGECQEAAQILPGACRSGRCRLQVQLSQPQASLQARARFAADHGGRLRSPDSLTAAVCRRVDRGPYETRGSQGGPRGGARKTAGCRRASASRREARVARRRRDCASRRLAHGHRRAGSRGGPRQPPAFWGQMAKRLVDSQAPGLARRGVCAE